MMAYILLFFILLGWFVCSRYFARGERNAFESMSRSAKETATRVRKLQAEMDERFQASFANLAIAFKALNLSDKALPPERRTTRPIALLLAARKYEREAAKLQTPARAEHGSYVISKKEVTELMLKLPTRGYGASKEPVYRAQYTQMDKKKHKEGVRIHLGQIPSYSRI